MSTMPGPQGDWAAQWREEKAPERPTAVYWLYDAEDELLYVGMTNNPIQRFAEHLRDKHWWPSVASYSIRWYDTRARAEAGERSAILNDGPIHNVEHQPRNKRDGGLCTVPNYLAYQFYAALDRLVGRLLPSATDEERLRIIAEFNNSELANKIFIFYRRCAPAERTPLDMAAVLAAVDAFGPLIAPADPRTPASAEPDASHQDAATNDDQQNGADR